MIFKKINNKKEKKRVGASILSLLSGNPDAEDKQHHHIRTLVDNARYELSIQAFSRFVTSRLYCLFSGSV